MDVFPYNVQAFASASRTTGTAKTFMADGASGMFVTIDCTAVATPANEISTVGIGTSTGGTFVLSYGGVNSTAIDFDSTAAEVDTIIQAIAGITATTVTGGNATLDYEVATLDRGTSTGGTWNVTLDGVATAEIAFDASAAVVKAAFEAISTVNTVTVTGTGTTIDQWVCTFDDPIKDLTVTGDGALLTGGDSTLTYVETTTGVPATDFVIEVTNPGNTAMEVTGDGALLTGTGASLSVVETQLGAGVVSVVFNVDLHDSESGTDTTILDSAAITATGTTVMRVHPSLTASANLIAKDMVPNVVRITPVHATADAVSYSVNVQLVK